MAYPENTGGVAADQLCSIVERVERLRDEITALNADVAEVYKEARGNGFHVPSIKAVISERAKIAKDPKVYQENEALLELYRDAIERGTRNATRAGARGTPNPPSPSDRDVSADGGAISGATVAPQAGAPVAPATLPSPTPESREVEGVEHPRGQGGDGARGGTVESSLTVSPVPIHSAAPEIEEPDLPAAMNRKNWIDGTPPTP